MSKQSNPLLLQDKELAKLIELALKYKRTEEPFRVSAQEKSEFEENIVNAAAQAGININKEQNLTYILDILEVDNFIPFEALAPTAAILSALNKQ